MSRVIFESVRRYAQSRRIVHRVSYPKQNEENKNCQDDTEYPTGADGIVPHDNTVLPVPGRDSALVQRSPGRNLGKEGYDRYSKALAFDHYGHRTPQRLLECHIRAVGLGQSNIEEPFARRGATRGEECRLKGNPEHDNKPAEDEAVPLRHLHANAARYYGERGSRQCQIQGSRPIAHPWPWPACLEHRDVLVGLIEMRATIAIQCPRSVYKTASLAGPWPHSERFFCSCWRLGKSKAEGCRVAGRSQGCKCLCFHGRKFPFLRCAANPSRVRSFIKGMQETGRPVTRNFEKLRPEIARSNAG